MWQLDCKLEPLQRKLIVSCSFCAGQANDREKFSRRHWETFSDRRSRRVILPCVPSGGPKKPQVGEDARATKVIKARTTRVRIVSKQVRNLE
jgi:hypothetical protein